MVKVSVVVPIYNAEKYLDRSINSLRQQSLKDIEIILVNDGSQDKSLSICEKYEKQDERIKVIDKPNGGVSSARNKGLEIATGEFIAFMDPDDWIETDMFYYMYNKAKITNADGCICNFTVDNSITSLKNSLPTFDDIKCEKSIIEKIVSNVIAGSDLDRNGQTIMGSVWRLLVKRSLIISNKIEFKNEIPFMEDFIWCIEIFLSMNKLAVCKEYFYHYMINGNTASVKYRNDYHEIQMNVYYYLESTLQKYGLEFKLKDFMERRYVNMFINSIANEVHVDCKKSFKERLKAISYFCKDKKLRNILNNVDTTGYTIRKKTILTSIKYNIYIYIYIYYFINLRLIKNKL